MGCKLMKIRWPEPLCGGADEPRGSRTLTERFMRRCYTKHTRLRMPCKLIIIAGSHAGEQFVLGGDEVFIGRAPSCHIQLKDPACAWRHCTVRPNGDGGYEVVDARTAAGTFVNGMRQNYQRLENGDQIAIGETVIAFSNDALDNSVRGAERTLLLACSLLFGVRALAETVPGRDPEAFDAHVASILCDLTGCSKAFAALSRHESSAVAACRERAGDALGALVSRAWREGVTVDAASGWTAAPIYVRGSVRGVLCFAFARSEAAAADRQQTISAVATLAAAALESAEEIETLRTEKSALEESAGISRGGIVGESSAVRKVLQVVERVAPLDTTVLIMGESGTGKELAARALHDNSPRRSRPFVAINCAALTESLLESELFGHEKGAFTGAVAQKKGKLELADGGTVFLDEIGELAPGLQAKLLRVLQQREFERVGGSRTLPLDIRVVAATNRDLGAEVKKGAFREDLYHRLNVIVIRMPPLRERKMDIAPLARLFVERAAARCGRRVLGLSKEAEARLMAYHWPGNIRELENAIERAVVLGETEWVLPEDLPETVLETAHAPEPAGGYYGLLGEAKRESIQRAWAQANGDYKVAARLLGLHPNSLLRLIRNLGLRDTLRAAQ
jgi:two-component system response regulator HydG